MFDVASNVREAKRRNVSTDAPESEWVREGVLVEGLQDAVALGEVHNLFAHYGAESQRPTSQVQQLTLHLIRELVEQGLAVLGTPDRRGNFNAWDLPLDDAMAKIEDAYITHFADRRGWTHMGWLNLTDQGEQVALELYHAGETET
jgi:hypothetical protein